MSFPQVWAPRVVPRAVSTVYSQPVICGFPWAARRLYHFSPASLQLCVYIFVLWEEEEKETEWKGQITTLPAASGKDPSGVFLEPFQAVTNKVRSFYKPNFNISLSSASPDAFTSLLITAGKRLHPHDAKDHVSLR